ncbi:disease resistance RPP13-like protein 4 [Rhododendron vialii]|uniref:disease resistance RPP13-like protein 4 n=1 Tax=Rhododendron vialii TaxID=182163 RepID=UPI00265E407B|nr:disease resistance RPP13-like protein 4 [Rhododendron vialii]
MLARSSEFQDFKALYAGLGDKQKVCLLCFSAFPEKEIIKKTFMFYWWTGEGFVAPVKGTEKTAEELANDVFSELMAKGFIEPISEKRTSDWGKHTGNFSSSYRVCLLAGEKLKGEGMDNVHMLFNVDHKILDFEKPELFAMMKNSNLLCLGRWQTSQRHHIEVEDTKFLKGLKNMKHLMFLSLQRISQIMDLPTSVSNLMNITILDISACPNLEKIPGEIGLLKSLTHLDMSECYLLVNMPKEISTLLELEVLKGFVVENLEGKEKDSCTLEDLADLPKLRKLSIFTGRKDFP